MANKPPTPPSTAADVELANAPTDGITSLRIVENKYLLASSWDTVNFTFLTVAYSRLPIKFYFY